MPKKKNKKYEVFLVQRLKIGEDDYRWIVDVEIRRPWPLSWVDHRPWEKFPRHPHPVKTFIGKGVIWSEYGTGRPETGDLVPILNAIVAEVALEMLSSSG